MARAKNINPGIAQLLRAWRGATGKSRLEISRSLSVAKTTVSNWELGQNEPSAVYLIALAGLAEGEYERAFLLAAKEKAGLTGEDIASIAKSERREIEQAPAGSDRRTKNRRNTPFVEVHLVEVMAGAGPGRITDHEDVEGSLMIPKDICPNPRETACVRIRGESMEPTILNGTIVAVDRSQRRIEKLTGKIVAAWHETEGVMVKRLVRAEGKLRLVSDNPGYYPRDVDEGWQVVGRVIWWIQQA